MAYAPGARILVVDDDGAMRALAASALRSVGHQVITVEDGVAALAALQRQSVDLIVCDVAMPGMDGRELGQALQGLRDRIPILYISAAEQLPATLPGAFLRKPFRYEVLTGVVSELLAKRRPPRGPCARGR